MLNAGAAHVATDRTALLCLLRALRDVAGVRFLARAAVALSQPHARPDAAARARRQRNRDARVVAARSAAPYKWGGAGPRTFDCSGLVQYVHEQIGILAPRTAAEQYVAARPVALSVLAPGDLLFFAIKGSRISHVAIYAGEGRFVHAPQTGRPVELRMLDDDFYRPRLVGAGRLF
jgi:cell wall-associated NlpC family hydrolase